MLRLNRNSGPRASARAAGVHPTVCQMSQPANAYKATRKRRPRPVANHQMCIFCRTLARPNVVMDQKKDIRVVNPPKKFYTNWEVLLPSAAVCARPPRTR